MTRRIRQHRRCRTCNRKLSDRESRVRGYGPVCWEKRPAIRMAALEKMGQLAFGSDDGGPNGDSTTVVTALKRPDGVIEVLDITNRRRAAKRKASGSSSESEQDGSVRRSERFPHAP